MTDEQINAAIAEACGITRKHGIEDYVGDLNAMHEAEKIVTSDCNLTYSSELARITDAHYSDDPDFFCATARQRAEAFLRTLGKWEETR